jgi:alkylation response protein AidB-like acyl-CoA dehydrogenase
MDFSLSEETVLLKNSAERYLAEKCPSSFVKEFAEDENGFSKSVWKEMAELGWLGLMYDEKFGGSGGSFFDLCVLFEEMGKALLPSPFFCSTVVCGLLINEAGDEELKAHYLSSISSGNKILSIATLDENGREDFREPRLKALATGDVSYVLEGTMALVPFAHVADEILVCANLSQPGRQGPTLFRVNRGSPRQRIIVLDTLALEKMSTVVFEGTEVSSSDILGEPGEGASYIEAVLPKAIICKCAEMLGGLQRVVDMTVSYVKERHQFGRPLGALQVVQHNCVDMTTYLETARLLTYQAASLLSEGIACGKEVAMAKAWCSDGYKKCTWIAQQLHGGIGFSEEHDLHLYYKHAKAAELLFGDSWFHRKKVADEMGI